MIADGEVECNRCGGTGRLITQYCRPVTGDPVIQPCCHCADARRAKRMASGTRTETCESAAERSHYLAEVIDDPAWRVATKAQLHANARLITLLRARIDELECTIAVGENK